MWLQVATTTTNLKLEKPDTSDFYDVEVFNRNADTIDKNIANIKNVELPKLTTKEEFNNLQVGTRNLARNTSSEWETYANFDGTANKTIPLCNVYLTNFKENDKICYSIECEYENLVATPGKEISVQVQGAGDITGWTSSFPSSTIKGISGSGTFTLTKQSQLTNGQCENNYYKTYIIADNIQSGVLKWRNFKVVKGNKVPIDWTPAPEDIDKKLTNHPTTDEMNAAIKAENDCDIKAAAEVSVATDTLEETEKHSSLLRKLIRFFKNGIFSNSITVGTRDTSEDTGLYSVSSGKNNVVNNTYSVAFGVNCKAENACTFARGEGAIASGQYSYSSGKNTEATGMYAHAEGMNTTASNSSAHAEGINTVASGTYSHAEGSNTQAMGICSHAEGWYAKASGAYSHASGYNTVAAYEKQTVHGAYNNNQSTNLYELGNGTSDTNRSNAFSVDKNGNAIMQGGVILNQGSSNEYKLNEVKKLLWSGSANTGDVITVENISGYTLFIAELKDSGTPILLTKFSSGLYIRGSASLAEPLADTSYWQSYAVALIVNSDTELTLKAATKILIGSNKYTKTELQLIKLYGLI